MSRILAGVGYGVYSSLQNDASGTGGGRAFIVFFFLLPFQQRVADYMF